MSCPGTKVDCNTCEYNTDEYLLCLHPKSNTLGFGVLIKDGSCYKRKRLK